MARALKNVSQLEKWVTLRKMCHNWKNVFNLEKCAHLENCIRIGKMCHNWENGSQLEKYVTLGKLRDI